MIEENEFRELGRMEMQTNALFIAIVGGVLGCVILIFSLVIAASELPYAGMMIACFVVVSPLSAMLYYNITKYKDAKMDVRWETDNILKTVKDAMELIESSRTFADLDLEKIEKVLKNWPAEEGWFSEHAKYILEQLLPRIKEAKRFFDNLPQLKITDVI